MLESTNPEIDAAALQARLQSEAQRAEAGGPPVPGDPPPGLISGPFSLQSAEIAGLMAQVRESNQVRPGIPYFLHTFFRNQGRCNRLLLRVIELQQSQITHLHTVVNLQAEQLGQLHQRLDASRAGESPDATPPRT